ncbi:MAG: ankyrin repeat domain-containing protein [Proteobacteria bacterium]|nr:ankyrin repeat domain-containing protein [Pseudomonadota bacterium]
MADPRSDSSLESLRKQAKRWLRELRRGDAAALQRLERVLPRHSTPPVLREVQQALAREQGLASWAELREQRELEALAASGRHELLQVFLEHACIFTPPRDFPSKWRRAERIHARHPELATASIHSAVVCGEVGHVRRLLDAEPALLTARGGPQQWEPLLFACYGRLPNERARRHALEVATLLLERGADPNAHFVTPDDWKLRFSALTGAMGQGEMGQPEHPEADALARLLLQRGADPNESQGLYNTHLVGDDTRWLELLFQHGLCADHRINWHAEPEAATHSGFDPELRVLDYLVCGAAQNAHTARLEILLAHGANPDATSFYDGKSCYEHALMSGSREAVELLRRYGATVVTLAGHDAFVAAVRTGRRAEALQSIRDHPDYRELAGPLTVAAGRGETEVVRLLLELGVDPNRENQHGHLALHNACQHREIAELLLQHGADPRARAFGGTVCQWAANAGGLELARFHAEQSRSLLDAATSGHLELAQELLRDDAGCLEERSPEGDGPLHLLCADAERAEPLISLLLQYGADPTQRNDAGETPAQHLEAAGSDEIADLLDAARDESR